MGALTIESMMPEAVPPLAVGRNVCTDFARSSRLEWLETNGCGSFAMGTVAGVNTRRYHGLLVAALRPPVDRHVLLSRLEETVSGVPLSTVQYPGTVAPRGYVNLLEFRLDPWPTWVFDVGGAHVEKELFLVPGEQTVVVQYRATRARTLTLAPFVAFRDYHALQRSHALNGTAALDGSRLRVRPYEGMPALTLHVPDGAELAHDGCWYYDHEYLAELDRGLDFREDLWKLGTLTLQLEPEKPAFLVAT